MISKLKKILDEIDANSKLAKKIRAAVESAKTTSWFTLSSIVYDSAYDDISIGVDISSFCHSKKVYFKNKFDENIFLRVIKKRTVLFF